MLENQDMQIIQDLVKNDFRRGDGRIFIGLLENICLNFYQFDIFGGHHFDKISNISDRFFILAFSCTYLLLILYLKPRFYRIKCFNITK